MTFKDLDLNRYFVFSNQTFEPGVCRKVALGMGTTFEDGCSYGYLRNGIVFPCSYSAEIIPLDNLHSEMIGMRI